MVYRLAYSSADNVGDKLNPYIFERVLGVRVEHVSLHSYNIDILGIGSSLRMFQSHIRKKERLKHWIGLHRPMNVWGTGFICAEGPNEAPFNRKMRFLAVRGEMSKDRVERLTGRKLGADFPTGDGGILTAQLFDKPIHKRCELGIIPHFSEQDAPAFQKLLSLSPNAKLIDITGDVMETCEMIASCEYILSSSLHGLIIADSFGIPNLHVKATDRMRGDGFKFMDYYSAYGLRDDAVDLNQDALPAINDIIDRYRIDRGLVEEKKKRLVACFSLR